MLPQRDVARPLEDLPQRARRSREGERGRWRKRAEMLHGVAFCCISGCYCHVGAIRESPLPPPGRGRFTAEGAGGAEGGKERRRRGLRRRCRLRAGFKPAPTTAREGAIRESPLRDGGWGGIGEKTSAAEIIGGAVVCLSSARAGVTDPHGLCSVSTVRPLRMSPDRCLPRPCWPRSPELPVCSR